MHSSRRADESGRIAPRELSQPRRRAIDERRRRAATTTRPSLTALPGPAADALNAHATRYAHWLDDFWGSGWNVFDFIVVMVSIVSVLPFSDLPGIAILRLLRAFRVFRLFKRLESLRKIIMAIEAAIPGVINAFSILLLVIALYAILGVEFFSITNREYFGDFGRSMFTLFQVSPTRTAKTTRRCDPIRHR